MFLIKNFFLIIYYKKKNKFICVLTTYCKYIKMLKKAVEPFVQNLTQNWVTRKIVNFQQNKDSQKNSQKKY